MLVKGDLSRKIKGNCVRVCHLWHLIYSPKKNQVYFIIQVGDKPSPMTEIQVSSSNLSLEYMIELLEAIRVYKEDRESENQLWNKAAMSCFY